MRCSLHTDRRNPGGTSKTLTTTTSTRRKANERSRTMAKSRQRLLEELRVDLDIIPWRSICEGCADDERGEELETKIHGLMVRARKLRPENFDIDGTPINNSQK